MENTSRRAGWQLAPTEAQISAVANSTRLRILRLCRQREMTNKDLADQLGLDPSTTHRHVRRLVDAGLLDTSGVRQGDSGAYEKPYRTNDQAWRLSFDNIVEDDDSGDLAMLNAFRADLADAGNDSIVEMTSFSLQLDDASLVEFVERFKALLIEFRDNAPVAGDGVDDVGGLFVVHRLAHP